MFILTCSAEEVIAQPSPNSNNIASYFEVIEIAKNVYSVIRKDPPGLMCDGNSGFVITDDFVVVIDAPEATKEIIKEIKKLTPKPVKYVINTHWHDDHITGNQVYKNEFPNCEFIAHTATKDYLPEQGLKNREQMISGAPGGVAYLKGLLEKNAGPDGSTMTQEERDAFTNDIKLVEHYLDYVPSAEIILPTITFKDKYVIENSSCKIEVLKIGNGHTAGDVIVLLPEDGILFSGDLIVSPIPLVGGNQSHVLDWDDALKNLIALNPHIIIPGHGQPMRDTRYVQLLIILFKTIEEQIQSSVNQNKTLEETRKVINLDELKKEFAGESKLKNFLFSTYVTYPSITAAYNELVLKKDVH